MDAIGKTRDTFPQTLKGVCIIFVVLIHLPWGENGEWSAWMWIAVRKLINFAVATFFFLSAYYSKSFVKAEGNSISGYYKKRLSRLLIPYAVWASVYTFIMPLITSGHIDDRWIFHFFTGKGPTYFLLALTQFTILLPFIQKYKNNRWADIAFFSVTPIYLVFYYTYNFYTGQEFRPEQFFCFPWFACYYMGLKMQEPEFKERIQRMSVLALFPIIIGLLSFSIVEASFIYRSTGILSFAISQITLGSVVYSLGLIVMFCVLWGYGRDNKRNILTHIGDYSMGIFLMHPFFNWVFKFTAIHVPGGRDFYGTDSGLIIVHVATLAFSVWASLITAKTLSDRYPKLIKILGLK